MLSNADSFIIITESCEGNQYSLNKFILNSSSILGGNRNWKGFIKTFEKKNHKKTQTNPGTHISVNDTSSVKNSFLKRKAEMKYYIYIIFIYLSHAIYFTVKTAVNDIA